MSAFECSPPSKRIKCSSLTVSNSKSWNCIKLSPNFASDLFRTILRRNNTGMYKYFLSGSDQLQVFADELKKPTTITTVDSDVIVAWDSKTKFIFNLKPGSPHLYYFLRCAVSNFQTVIVRNVVPIFQKMITEAVAKKSNKSKAISIIYYPKDHDSVKFLLNTKKAMDYLFIRTDILAHIDQFPINIATDTLHLVSTRFTDFSQLLRDLPYRMRKLKVSFMNNCNMLDWNDVQAYLLTHSPTQTFPVHPGITSVCFSAHVDHIHPAMHALVENISFIFPNVRRFTFDLRIYSKNKVTVADYDTINAIYQLKSLIHTMSELIQLQHELVIRISRTDQVILKVERGQSDVTKEFKRIRNSLKTCLPFVPSDKDVCFRQKYMIGSNKKLDYGLTIVSKYNQPYSTSFQQ